MIAHHLKETAVHSRTVRTQEEGEEGSQAVEQGAVHHHLTSVSEDIRPKNPFFRDFPDRKKLLEFSLISLIGGNPIRCGLWRYSEDTSPLHEDV